MPNAETTYFVTSTTSVPAATITAVTTSTVFEFVSPSPTASMKARYVRNIAGNLVERQATTTNAASQDPAYVAPALITSACACNRNLQSSTRYSICTSTLTVYDTVEDQTIITTFQTITSGTTTEYKTVNSTSTVTLSNTTSSSGTTWTVVISSTTPSTSTGMTASSATNNTSTALVTTSTSAEEWDPVWSDLTTTTTSTTSSSTSTSTVQPSGCPYNNGTIFSSNTAACTYYERICYRTYADSDFYEPESYYDTPEECSAVCDAQNRGGRTLCLGIVWNTTTTSPTNCRQLKSLKSPIFELSSIALILRKDPKCNSTSTSATMTSTSSSMASSMSTNGTISTTTTSSSSGNMTVKPTIINTTGSSSVQSISGTMTNSTTLTSTTRSTSTSNSTTMTISTTSSTVTSASTGYYNTTSIALNGTTSASCLASTIYSTSYITVPGNDGNSSWNGPGTGSPPDRPGRPTKMMTTAVTTTTETVYVTASPSVSQSTVTVTDTVTKGWGPGGRTKSGKYETVTVTRYSSTVSTSVSTATWSTTITSTVSTCPADPGSVTTVSPASSSSTTTTTTTTTKWGKKKGFFGDHFGGF